MGMTQIMFISVLLSLAVDKLQLEICLPLFECFRSVFFVGLVSELVKNVLGILLCSKQCVSSFTPKVASVAFRLARYFGRHLR